MSTSAASSSPPEVGYDVIAVKGFDKGFGVYSSTEFFIHFSNNTSIFKAMFRKEGASEEVSDDEDSGRDSFINFSRTPSLTRAKSVIVRCNDVICSTVPAFMVNDRLVFVDSDGVYTPSPPSSVLEKLRLGWGRNTLVFECREYQCEVSCSVW